MLAGGNRTRRTRTDGGEHVDSPTGPSGERRLAGRYRLESVLGRGGMGGGWAAHDELLHRPAAIKEVLAAPGLSGEEVGLMRRRTVQEARAAARLSSPAAVLVYDVVDQDGEPWVVMERLAARTLADVLDERGPLPPDEVATLGLRLLDALDAAHAVGVMHRDVKPANVMFRGDADMANAVLTDFGIARFDGDPATTATGTLIGSPAFVAPERARGDQARPASDLWALGITLWIAAEGVSPFHREGTLQTLTAVLTAEPPAIRRAGPLAPALVGLLAKDPSERLDSRRLRALLRPMAGRAAAAATQTMPVPVREPQPEPVPQAEPVRQPVPVPEPVPGPVGAGQKGPPGAGLETSPQHGDTGPPRGSDGSDRGPSPAGRRRVGLLA